MMKKMTTSRLIVLICLAVTICESARWLQEKEEAYLFYVGDDVVINCSLSDPNINVTLWLNADKSGNKGYHRVVPKGHVQQFKQIFRLSNISLSDNGQYECRADNISSFKVLVIHMSHEGEPKPVPRISHGEIKYGNDVQLDCSANAWAQLTWYKSKKNGTRKDWKLMKSIKTVGKLSKTVQSLTIEKFNVSDYGVYICELHRKSVKWTKHVEKYLGLDTGFEKPRFTIFPESFLTRNENSELYESYEVKGIPTPLIKWYRVIDGKEDLLSKCYDDVHDCRMFIDDSYDIVAYEIFIEKLRFPRDNATFKCIASNSLGSVTKQFTLNVLGKPQIAAMNEKKRDLVHVYTDGSPATELVCNAVANPDVTAFTWMAQLTDWRCTKDNCPPNESNWQIITGEENGIKIVSTNKKSTIFLKPNEAHMFYRCTAENKMGKDHHDWAIVPITGPTPLKAEKSLVVVDEDGDASLSCRVAMFTSNKVEWSYNNTVVLQSLRMRVENSTNNGTVYNKLHIKKVRATDAGTYKCFGEFNGAIIDAEITLKVLELKAPVVFPLRPLTKMQDSSFVVRCNFSGHPQPRITWRKDGKILKALESIQGDSACNNMIKGIYKLTDEKKDYASGLVICHADYLEHLGEFSCTAHNKLGNDTATALININAPSKIKTFQVTKMELGKAFSLTCVADGNPKPRVRWMKQDVKTSKFIPVANKQPEKLHFDILDATNLGEYQCIAQNEFETDRENFSLRPPVLGKSAAPPPSDSKKYAVVIGCVSFFILIIVIIVSVVLYKRKKIYGGFYILTLPPLPDYIKKLDPHTPLTEQTNKLPYDAEWEFPRNRLKFSRELGSGAFGKVFLADAMGIVAFDPRNSTKRRSSRRRFGGSVRRNHYVNNNKMTKVAVKTLKEDSGETEYKDLLSELKILIHVGEHKNIVNLLGACTKGRESELWVIIEYCSNGNLLQFLRNRRDIYETEWKGVSKDPNIQLTMTDLVIAAYQIARGMEFLASRLCIHRDLATRNILVMDNYVIKIADFGLARDVGEDSQYVKTSTGLLPVKWMAIEAIIQRLFTEKSDVWSFGIVLWELFTLGGTPYPNIPPNEVAEFLARGRRMEPPHACPDEISTLMLKCWHEDKDCRPSFKELVEILDKIIELHTSSEGGCGYLEVQGEVMNEYLSPSEVKSPHMDPFECNSPLPPLPSPGENELDSLLLRDQNARGKKFHFDKAIPNRATRQDSEIEKMRNDRIPEIIKNPDVLCRPASKDLDGYIDTSLTGKEKERIERDLEKDRDSSEEPHQLGDYAYWKKSLV